VKQVHEPPQQALALVGELGAVGGDVLDQRVDGLLDGGDGLGLVPDGAVVGLVGAWGGAVEGGVVANGGGGRGVVPGLGSSPEYASTPGTV